MCSGSLLGQDTKKISGDMSGITEWSSSLCLKFIFPAEYFSVTVQIIMPTEQNAPADKCTERKKYI